ncbi:MAG: diguanylate cyclase [Planctomycetota bacterium]
MSKGNDSSYAREALTTIAKLKLPPLPMVYEVFFIHFAGFDPSISELITPRLEVPGAIDLPFIERVHSQLRENSELAQNGGFSNRLSEQLSDFKEIVRDQQKISEDYSEVLEAASDEEDWTQNDTKNAVESLIEKTQDLQHKLSATTDRVRQAESKVAELENELFESQRLIMIDPLTGVGNRRFFDAVASRRIRKRSSSPQFLAYIDCDRFKAINDQYGHAFGDKIIQIVASTIRGVDPIPDVIRLGGDEFAVFCSFEGIDEANEYVEAVRLAVGNLDLIDPDSGGPLKRITMSIGLTPIRSNDDPQSWADRADRLQYQAKKLGGDRIMVERSAGIR